MHVTSNKQTPSNPRVELTFGPTVVLVSVVRQFISQFYAKVLGKGVTDLIAMATHELLENALKYSSEEGATLIIDVEPEAAADRVTIRIRNRAADAHIQPLQAMIASMQAEPDPLMHYMKAMRETAKRREGSGLGLLRLRAEADMTLSLEVNGNDVCIVARCQVERANPS